MRREDGVASRDDAVRRSILTEALIWAGRVLQGYRESVLRAEQAQHHADTFYLAASA